MRLFRRYNKMKLIIGLKIDLKSLTNKLINFNS
jgi:hypothetical protein